MTEIKVFNKWNVDGVAITDPGLEKYMNISPKFVPKSNGRFSQNRFHKSKMFIVERLINKLSIAGHKNKKHFKSSGHLSGKIMNSHRIVEDAFAIVESRTKENPIKVFVTAVQNAAPREEIITIEYGGARYPKAVECAPQRRIDFALRQMAQGVYHKTFNSKKTAAGALADEIVNAYSLSSMSSAIQKKLELERQADSSR